MFTTHGGKARWVAHEDFNRCRCGATCIATIKKDGTAARQTRPMLCKLALNRGLKHKKEEYWT